nr:MAG TPA: hypothetical protein [Crassvirales sp.]
MSKEIEQIVQSGTMTTTDTVYDFNLDETQEDINAKISSFTDGGLEAIKQLRKELERVLIEINSKHYSLTGAEYDTYPTKDSGKLVRSNGIYQYIINNTLEYNCSRNNNNSKYSLDEAIGVIPEDFRVPGIRISFISKISSKYVIYQNVSKDYSSAVTDWELITNDVFTSNVTWNTDVEKTRIQIPINKRTIGFVLSYVNTTNNKPIVEQYIGNIYTDTEWAKDDNWVPVNKRYIKDSLDSDSIEYALTANQGRVLKELIDEGYKYFGIATPATVPEQSKVKGYYIAYTVGEYIHFSTSNGNNISIQQPTIKFIYCSNPNRNVWQSTEIPVVMQSTFNELKRSVDNIESIKTSVLTEEEYSTLASSGKLEADKFYFTHEEE